MRKPTRLLIAIAGLALAGTAAKIASGDVPERVMGSGATVSKKERVGVRTENVRSPSDAIAVEPCVKCDGAMSPPLTDADIQAAGDDAAILVLGLRETYGITQPVWADWAVERTSYSVPGVPLPQMPRGHAWPVPGRHDTPWLYVPGRPVVMPVPEPETWAMMLVGFGGIGWRLRRVSR